MGAKTIIFEKTYWESDEPHECELCGFSYDDGFYWSIEGDDIWESSSTGCFGGYETPESLIDVAFKKIEELFVKYNWFKAFHPDANVYEELSKVKEKIGEIGFSDEVNMMKAVALFLEDCCSVKTQVLITD